MDAFFFVGCFKIISVVISFLSLIYLPESDNRLRVDYRKGP